MTAAVLVALGAAIGAPSRWLVDRSVRSRWPSDFPWGTLTVNLSGSFVLVVERVGALLPEGGDARPFLGVEREHDQTIERPLVLRAHRERLLEVRLGLALLVLRQLHLGDVRIERSLGGRVRGIDEEERPLVRLERAVPVA